MRRIPSISELRSRVRDFWTHSVTNKIVMLCVAIFVAQSLHWFFANAFSLNAVWVHEGFWLNFVSYGFLHGDFWHLALNMLALYFAGNAVERYDSTRNALIAFFGGVILGGIAWYACVLAFAVAPLEATLVGASAGIAALFAYFSVLYRDSEIRAMIFFVLPVKMRAWVIFAVLAALSLFGLVADELPALRSGLQQSVSIAHSAHLGGILFGAIFALVYDRFRGRFGNVRYFHR